MTRQRRERSINSNGLKGSLFVMAFLLTLLGQFMIPNARANPSVSLDMVVSSPDVEPGDALILDISFNNSGTNQSSSVWINVSASVHLTYAWDNSFIEGGTKTGDYNWTFPNVTVGNHGFMIEFNVSGTASDMEKLDFSAHLDYLNHLGQPMAPPPDVFASSTVHRPVMTLWKEVETGTISPGQTFNYTVFFENIGSINASTVYINDFQSPFLVYINDTASLIGGTKFGPSNWSFSDIVGSLNFDITFQALSGLPDGLLITNTVNLQYRNFNGVWFPEVLASNNTMVVIPNIQFQKAVDRSVARIGDTLDYTLTINNTGLGNAKTVWMNDTLPDDTDYLSSSPNCDSIIGNTCSWTLNDVAPGVYPFSIQARINSSAQAGTTLTNNASLNYTNSLGEPMANLSSNASTVVEQTFLVLILQSRTETSTPNDIFEFDVMIRGTSPLPSLAAWLNITFPGDIEYISDNATDVGGVKTGNYRWEFTNVPQGDRSFTIVTRIDSETTDMQTLNIDLRLDHTNERGESLPTASDRITITIHSPILSSQIAGIKTTFESDETLVFTVFLNNTGSVRSQSAWLNLSTPSTLRYISDTSSTIGGTSTGELSYEFSNVSPGNYEFQISLSFEGTPQDHEQIEVWVFLNYTDSNGDFIREYARNAVCKIVVPSGEFPWLLVVAGILLACIIAFAGAFSRESSKYSILLFFVPLYSRLRRREVLDHETRGMIRGYIIANPGDHFNSIKAALDLRNGTLAHHLNVLEREDMVKSIKDGKYRRFFPIGMKVPERAFPTKIEMMILDLVRKRPGISQKEIATHLGMSQPTVSYHINKLKKSRRLRTEKHGMSLKHYVMDSKKES